MDNMNRMNNMNTMNKSDIKNTLNLSLVAQYMRGQLVGEDGPIQAVKTDSRLLNPGDLFVALEGQQVDGHQYVKEAEAKGAAGIVASKPIQSYLPVILVKNTLLALGELAKSYKNQRKIPTVAITGSCGKTTVKEMIGSILSRSHKVLMNQGNQNTDVGVPLTLLNLTQEHEIAVIEMGARKKNDIQYLMSLTQPVNISLITNAGIAHVEIFGSKMDIAKAKGEIFEALDSNGIAIINADDPSASYWKTLIKNQKIITFGIQTKADVMAMDCLQKADVSEFTVRVLDPSIIFNIKLNVPGLHNIQNALAAIAVSLALKIPVEEIREGLSQFVNIKGRLNFLKGQQNTLIIDDTYNANPISVKAALTVLAKNPGEKIFVMGDMFELGENSVALHEEVGRYAKELGIHYLFGVGKNAHYAVIAFGEGAKHYPDKASLIADIKPFLNPQTTLLIKGGRSMKMEEVVDSLIGK